MPWRNLRTQHEWKNPSPVPVPTGALTLIVGSDMSVYCENHVGTQIVCTEEGHKMPVDETY